MGRRRRLDRDRCHVIALLRPRYRLITYEADTGRMLAVRRFRTLWRARKTYQRLQVLEALGLTNGRRYRLITGDHLT